MTPITFVTSKEKNDLQTSSRSINSNNSRRLVDLILSFTGENVKPEIQATAEQSKASIIL